MAQSHILFSLCFALSSSKDNLSASITILHSIIQNFAVGHDLFTKFYACLFHVFVSLLHLFLGGREEYRKYMNQYDMENY